MHKSLIALSLIGATNIVSAARGQQNCEPTPPAACNAAGCEQCYCLGPVNQQGNAPVKPVTCDGDIFINVAGFYWNAHQDGMEYAIDNHVRNPRAVGIPPTTSDIEELNNLIDAEYKTPNFEWDWGFKLGLGYASSCDGWDFGVKWTWYQGKANDHIEAELDDNHTLLPIWSAFASVNGSVLFATDIETSWKLKLNLVDIELGREFWTSPRLSIRPFVGLRISFINQDFDIQNKGGSWSQNLVTPQQPAFNNFVELENDFKGAGLRSGLNTVWALGCGWGIYGDFAASLVYGRFNLKHDESNREAATPHDKTKILGTSECFRATRGMFDLALGLQWSTLLCDCDYGLTVQLGWEQHIFLHQNQLWRVMRIGDVSQPAFPPANNSGENVYQQRRGTLDTQGVTLSVKFEF